jgi:sterol desaturase/sphingolipid hydroxylase (fatty acid hydroxylase superfamily)
MTFDLVPYLTPVFAGLILLEILLWRFAGRGHYELRDSAASLLLGVGETIVRGLGGGIIIFATYQLGEALSPFAIPTNIGTIILCFLLSDFAYYWSHRVSHESRWFWASHIVHHSSQNYNFTTALRSSWTDVLSLSFMFWLPLVLLGFSAELVFAVRAVILVYQFWFHTETIGTLGFLERVLITPQHHKIHHARNPCYLDRNYGGVLLCWDQIFGTYVEQRADQVPHFGIVHSVAKYNPLILAFHEWIAMARDAVRARSLRTLWFTLFGPPGWRQDGAHRSSAALRQQWQEADARSRRGRHDE